MIQRPRLLIIDDDPEFCLLLKFQLKNFFLITTSAGGFEGYSRALSQRPDLIILDQHMEGWNGLRTLLAIRDNPKLKNVPVVMITSDASRELALSLRSAGANGYVRKDQLDGEKLVERLNELLPANQKLQFSS